MHLKCPSCAAVLAVAESLAGKSVRCSKCSQILQVPMAVLPVVTPIQAPAPLPLAPQPLPPQPPPSAWPPDPDIPMVVLPAGGRWPNQPPAPPYAQRPPYAANVSGQPGSNSAIAALAIVAIVAGALRLLFTTVMQGFSLFFSLVLGWSKARGMGFDPEPEQPRLYFRDMGGTFTTLIIGDCLFNVLCGLLMILCGIWLLRSPGWPRWALLTVCVASGAWLFGMIVYLWVFIRETVPQVSVFGAPYGFFGDPTLTWTGRHVAFHFLYLLAAIGIGVWIMVLWPLRSGSQHASIR